MSGTSSQEKGNALEDAVRAIESAIIRSFPGYSESTFRIEGKKRLEVAGVRHEIDVYVTAALGPGYDSTFLFECKNWKEKVGKNEIIVLSEKVRALGAQRGFFVAQSYSSDAVAQAACDPRLELLTASAVDPNIVAVPAGFHMVQEGPPHGEVVARDGSSQDGRARVALDLDAADFRIDGSPVPLRDYLVAWIVAAKDERCLQFPSLGVEGERVLTFEDRRTFASGQATVDGRPVTVMELSGNVTVKVVRAVVLSAFEVERRGRVITVQAESPEMTIKAAFVQLDRDTPA